MRRVVERNGLSESEASARVDAQLDNSARLAKAHVAICPQWSKDVTRTQVRLKKPILNIPFKVLVFFSNMYVHDLCHSA